MNLPNKKTELRLRVVKHNRSKTDFSQFKKAVFVNSLQELRELLQRQSSRLTVDDRLRKGVVEGGYTNPERIYTISQIANYPKFCLFSKSKRRNGIGDVRYSLGNRIELFIRIRRICIIILRLHWRITCRWREEGRVRRCRERGMIAFRQSCWEGSCVIRCHISTTLNLNHILRICCSPSDYKSSPSSLILTTLPRLS
eukprot:TRINITY_DN4936_c0_g3_i1.p1 TRINITY_DN4936_c0_g3~~TRINITY_DN4936_c0_g3_i1.p1  ORF type:complete len:198 (+),score=13.69 TRINITY_DN4936_c0_g3_i1:493-1086(+)